MYYRYKYKIEIRLFFCFVLIIFTKLVLFLFARKIGAQMDTWAQDVNTKTWMAHICVSIHNSLVTYALEI